ncbi:hypothetical protein VTH06DRAFT_1318 [Thermothelomyces fergusii]
MLSPRRPLPRLFEPCTGNGSIARRYHAPRLGISGTPRHLWRDAATRAFTFFFVVIIGLELSSYHSDPLLLSAQLIKRIHVLSRLELSSYQRTWPLPLCCYSTELSIKQD